MTSRPEGPPTISNSNFQKLPPLFQYLVVAMQDGRSGTLTVLDGDLVISVVVAHGRVTTLTHPDASSGALLDLLQRAGLLDDSVIPKAERYGRKHNLPLEDALVGLGRISAVTLSNVRESMCREVVLDLLLRRDIEVSASWTARKGMRENCLLPIPFLLREAQRRAAEAPAIRRVVASNDLVFTRVSQIEGRGATERWEDLRLSAPERQVYFFLDGKRNVNDLALATCQPVFDVGRSLRSLVEAGVVRRAVSGQPASATAAVSRSAVLRVATLIGAVLLLLAGIWAGAWTQAPRLGPDFMTTNQLHDTGSFATIAARAPGRRLAAAIRLYDLLEGRPPRSFADLDDDRLVLPSDVRAAATFPMGEGYLLQDPAEADGKTDQ